MNLARKDSMNLREYVIRERNIQAEEEIEVNIAVMKGSAVTTSKLSNVLHLFEKMDVLEGEEHKKRMKNPILE